MILKAAFSFAWVQSGDYRSVDRLLNAYLILRKIEPFAARE